MLKLHLPLFALTLMAGACTKIKAIFVPSQEKAKTEEITEAPGQELAAKTFPDVPAEEDQEPAMTGENSDQPFAEHPISGEEDGSEAAPEGGGSKEEAGDDNASATDSVDDIKTSAESASQSRSLALVRQGRKLVAEGEVQAGIEKYLLACQMGDREGCHKFAWHQARSGNSTNALRFYQVACEAGLSKSCNNVAILLEKDKKWDDALDFYARACLNQHDVSCENLKRLRIERLKLR